MKLARLFFKPRWQSADAAVRAAAVADMDDPELSAALPRIALEDPSARVRRAALWRLDRLDFYARCACDDADAGLRAEAAQRIRERIARDDGLPEDERLRWLARSEDTELVDYVLLHGNRSALRLAALERCRRPGRIAECALNDPDPELRLAAVERIDVPATLRRIADEARRKDKRVFRRARERLDALQGQDDSRRQREVAHACLAQLEAALADPVLEQLPALLEAVERDWQALAEDTRAPLERRYAGLRALLQRIPAPVAADRVEPSGDAAEAPLAQELLRLLAEPASATSEAADDARMQRIEALHRALLEHAGAGQAGTELARLLDEAASRLRAWRARQPLPAALAALLARAEAWSAAAPGPDAAEIEDLAAAWSRAWKALDSRGGPAEAAQQRVQQCIAAARAALAEAARQRAAAREALPAALDALADALDANALGPARAALARVQQLCEQTGEPEPPVRLLALEQRLRELSDWAHWSHTGLRQRLLDQVLALPEQGLHPDALATRVRELQAEWAKLDALEQDPSRPQRRSGGALGRRFREACRSVLAPAQAFFDKREALRSQRVEAVEALLGRLAETLVAADGAALTELRRALVEALRSLNELDPRRRKVLAQRLRDQLSAIDARLEADQAEIERQRRELVEAAARASASEDLKAAASQIKALQARWKALPRGRRGPDDASWSAFRRHADSVFARLDADRQRQQREREQREREASAALDALLSLPVDDRASLEQARKAWQRQRPALLEAQAALPALKPRLAAVERRLDEAEKALQRRERAASFAARLHGFAQPAESSGADPGAEQQARRLLLQLEILAGIDSPASDQALRREVQLHRLAERLGGGQAEPVDQAGLLLDRLVALSPALEPPLRADIAARLGVVLERLGS